MYIEKLGIPKQKVTQLNAADILYTEDVVQRYPSKYLDFRNPITNFDDCKDGIYSIVGVIDSIENKGKYFFARIKGEGRRYIYAYWFNQAFLLNQLSEGKKYIFCGKITIKSEFNNQIQILPMFFSEDIGKYAKIFPKYKKIKGMSDDYYKEIVDKCLNLFETEDYLLPEDVKRFGLISENDAFMKIHRPQTQEDIETAKNRFLFDTLFTFQFKMENENRQSFSTETDFSVSACKSWHELMPKLPFKLTDDQQDILRRLYSRIKQGNRINALVQGDVGSGKTIVAVFLAALMQEAGYQTAVIAPTEVLAGQHFEEFTKYLPEESVVLLTGSTKASEKKKILSRIKNNEVSIIVGTHSLIQPTVEYANLSMVIVDEQHRFGVEQRNALLSKEKPPHIINMSATPIPRTLAQASYGSGIEVYEITTKPNGRLPIITQKVSCDVDVNNAILREIVNGHQAYVICPMIEENEKQEWQAVEKCYLEMTRTFKNEPMVKIGVINGKMKNADIEDTISKFKNGEINVLISTTIVEVGVNIPNATLMVIKNSERFGLAQLHQLRGRVGRSSYQSYCLLQPQNPTDRKADIMCRYSNGFELAEQDLAMRGPGELLGSKQSGQNKFLLLMITYPELYIDIKRRIEEIYNDPDLYDEYSFINEADIDEVENEE